MDNESYKKGKFSTIINPTSYDLKKTDDKIVSIRLRSIDVVEEL